MQHFNYIPFSHVYYRLLKYDNQNVPRSAKQYGNMSLSWAALQNSNSHLESEIANIFTFPSFGIGLKFLKEQQQRQGWF